MTATERRYPAELAQIKRALARLRAGAPETMRGFADLHRAALTGEGALDQTTRELIALAIGVASRCDGCIAFHTHDALRAGASEAEISDALGVAVLMGGEPSAIYATHVVEAMDQFLAERAVEHAP